jgi:dipeptidyl aminopeptidase/acylaminoacyl peptidase
VFSYRLGREDDILKSPLLLRNFLGGKPSEKPDAYRDASPILNVTPETPPMLLLHGLRDSLVWYRQSERFSKALSRVGVRHLYIAFPWATHAFDYNHHGPGGQLAKYAVDYFLNLVTKD